MTTRVAWLTDVHFNFCEEHQVKLLAQEVRDQADSCVITGDIAEGDSVEHWIRLFQKEAGVSVHFVLGNHDFYGSTFGEVHDAVRHLGHLNASTPQTVGELWKAPVVLTGVDGWYDARAGNVGRSNVQMSDFTAIRTFNPVGAWGRDTLTHNERVSLCRRLGDASAELAQRKLGAATGALDARHVVFATHVPPFREACWYKNDRGVLQPYKNDRGVLQPCDDDWLPYFCNVTLGQTLLAEFRDWRAQKPDAKLTVLCGHTHGRYEFSPCEGFTVLVGGAEYGAPAIERVFEW